MTLFLKTYQMSNSPNDILKKYWGYDQFRELQLDIIESVLENRNTLALLPTGGGKSLCFQVPILCQGGVGIVISPLIALMNDQVDRLNRQGIKAIALHSGLNKKEIDTALDNCVQGYYKVIYLSPERAASDIFISRVQKMNVNLLAIDEAHCISQWGYDFRPSYLQIPELRKYLKDVPCLALTATATPKVKKDILDKLEIKDAQSFEKSFERSNLAYHVIDTEQKWTLALKSLSKINQSAIVYARNRKTTVEIANWLQGNGLSSDYYHAGLSAESREAKQKSWLEGATKIMVCTNAFGMGIDNPKVRLVLHLELPDSIEAYFQEAGRAGRDNNKAYSIILLGPNDINELQQKTIESFPDISKIRHIYQCLANHFQIGIGAQEGRFYEFDYQEFLKKYDLNPAISLNSFKILQREGIIDLIEGFEQTSRLKLIADRDTLYDYQLRNEKEDILIKSIFRTYGGLHLEYAPINESLLSHRSGFSIPQVHDMLERFMQKGLFDYIKKNSKSKIGFNTNRHDASKLNISDKNLKDRYIDLSVRVKSLESYLLESNMCRSKQLVKYFGQKSLKDCGICDVCEAKKEILSKEDISGILELIRNGVDLPRDLIFKSEINQRKVKGAISNLLENGKIEINEFGLIKLI